LQVEGLALGIVDEEAGVIEAEAAAEGAGDGSEELAGFEAGDDGVVDFEEGAQAVALAGELGFVGEGGFGVEGVIDA